MKFLRISAKIPQAAEISENILNNKGNPIVEDICEKSADPAEV